MGKIRKVSYNGYQFFVQCTNFTQRKRKTYGVNDGKALRLSASSSNNKFFIYMPSFQCKRSYKKEVIVNLNDSCVYSKSFLIITVNF